MPPLGGLALDRQLKLNPIAFDPARAEKMVQALRNLRARVHVAVDRMDHIQYEYETQLKTPQALLFAKVTKIDILTPGDELVATIPLTSLPAPGK